MTSFGIALPEHFQQLLDNADEQTRRSFAINHELQHFLYDAAKELKAITRAAKIYIDCGDGKYILKNHYRPALSLDDVRNFHAQLPTNIKTKFIKTLHQRPDNAVQLIFVDQPKFAKFKKQLLKTGWEFSEEWLADFENNICDHSEKVTVKRIH